MTTIKDMVNDLNQKIQTGKALEAFEKYYAEDCVMQENQNDPRVGKEANREYEQNFLRAVAQWNNAEVKSVATDEDNGVATVEWLLDFELQDGTYVKREQVAVQNWKDGKIVKKKFYYPEG